MQYLYVKHKEALIDIFTETPIPTHNFTKNMQKF